MRVSKVLHTAWRKTLEFPIVADNILYPFKTKTLNPWIHGSKNTSFFIEWNYLSVQTNKIPKFIDISSLIISHGINHLNVF